MTGAGLPPEKKLKIFEARSFIRKFLPFFIILLARKIHPHSHEENTIIERAIQEVQRHLRKIVFDIRVKHEWSIYLPLIQRIMNATIHAALGCAPASIIYGRALELDQNLLPLLQSRLEHVQNTPLKSYLSRAMEMQEHIIQIACGVLTVLNG